MKLLIFADLHYFGGDLETAIFNREQKQVQYAMDVLNRLTETANSRFKPDLCVNLGDLIQDDQDKQKDLAVFARVHEKLSGFSCPCFSILGNHDLKMMDSIEEMEALLGHASTWSVDVGGYHLVFLSPELRPELGIRRGGCYKAHYVGERTIRWLEADLKKNTLPALLFTHYPLSEDETVEDECLFMADRAQVKEVLKGDRNLLAVFSGHQHVTKSFVEDGVHYYLAGALVPAPKEDGTVGGEYLEIELQGSTVTVTPKRITL